MALIEEPNPGAPVDGRVDSEGGRSRSMLSTSRAAQPTGPLAPGQHWSVARKREVVLRLMGGEPAELVSRELGVPPTRRGPAGDFGCPLKMGCSPPH